jgi:hypothetical protein
MTEEVKLLNDNIYNRKGIRKEIKKSTKLLIPRRFDKMKLFLLSICNSEKQRRRIKFLLDSNKIGLIEHPSIIDNKDTNI